MKLRTIALLAIAATTLAGQALPVRREARQVTQPDGTTLTLTPVGDEMVHYLLTDDNQIVLPDGGAFYFAQIAADGTLAPSAVLASDSDKRSNVQAQYLSRLNQESMRQAVQATRQDTWMAKALQAAESEDEPAGMSRASSDRPWEGLGRMTSRVFPTTGSPKSMVILVEYQDVKFTQSDDDTFEYFNNLLNQDGFSMENGTGSACDYFRDASNGAFEPIFDLYGPVTLPQNRAYYGGNQGNQTDVNVGYMIKDAVDILYEEGVDFAQYDTDGNRRVDNVFIYYAGIGEAQAYPSEPDAVWPHNYEMRYYASTLGFGNAMLGYKVGNVYVNNYACSSELTTSSTFPYNQILDGIGTFVHEFSHVMGLPDLYDIYYEVPDGTTPGRWSVLDQGPYNNNSRTPPTYSSYERNALGWIDLIQLNESQELTIENLLDSNTAYVATTDVSNEFYLFENRQRISGTWDQYLPYRGMLVWHIDYKKSVFNNNKVNIDASHQYVDLVEASKVSDYSIPFPGSRNVTKFTPTSNPAFVSWSGASCELELTNIANEIYEPVYLTVTYTGAGISDVTMDNGVRIVVDGLSVKVDEGADAQIYDLTGRLVASGQGTLQVPAAGIYLVRSANATTKIAVR